MPSSLLPGAVLFTVLFWAPPLSGQEVDSLQAPGSTPQAVAAAPGQVTPRGAFFRSVLVPGWGHAKVGAHVRGAFYFATESATAFMLMKTQTRLYRVRDRRELLESVVRARLQGEGITDPIELEEAVAADEGVTELAALEETRGEQKEDWIALGIFLLFLGGADAYVSAHLADFPAAVEIEPRPSGGVEIGFSLPVGR